MSIFSPLSIVLHALYTLVSVFGCLQAAAAGRGVGTILYLVTANVIAILTASDWVDRLVEIGESR